MKNVKIVLVAEWDGWCGACAADRPLVLTRTGRQRLRTWLTGAADESRPLILTCRLCGTGVDVPLEQDDPPVVQTDEGGSAAEPWAGAGPPLDDVEPATDVPVVPDVPGQRSVPDQDASAAELTAARRSVAGALGALLAQRSTVAAVPQPVPVLAPAVPAPVPVLAPVAVAPPVAPPLPLPLPLQRTASSGGLTELQLLADGIDLLSTRRA